ncbi:hypothetical protein CXG81DRAFT_10588 [Caulochytrium protostelioides]|uniref:GID complex catalytic subunit 2 n=1 Tax=Caulochytrium protostelioides TaxID=1555241 RepID=A0A4P9XB69_9FUNG|nr:hypothetical protein CXG81DRAFT_10588 [Caulochytrium protostelioides]|eukprot:RKP02605.1 hypothetical protein CXG81DRAFT_10588 [Caulochytrium protostelioides]
MDKILPEFEKVAKRQKIAARESDKTLHDLVAQLKQARARLAASASSSSSSSVSASTAPPPPPTQDAGASADASSPLPPVDIAVVVAELQKIVKDAMAKLQEPHKEVQAGLYKYGRAIEKRFKTDVNALWDPDVLRERSDLLDLAIAQTFVREGRFALHDTFQREASLAPSAADDRALFEGLFRMLGALKAGDLEPAWQWVAQHSDALAALQSTLAYRLVSWQYMTLLQAGAWEPAVTYARQQFPRFRDAHGDAIQRLMGAVLYRDRLAQSPYADLVGPERLAQITETLTRDFCRLHQLPTESLLETAAMVGTLALPTLIKMASVLKPGVAWTQTSEMSVELPLINRVRYHSTFVCPVSKEQGTDANPPMLLTCGHMIARESLNRISKGQMNSKIKCTYCPGETIASQAQQLYF